MTNVRRICAAAVAIAVTVTAGFFLAGQTSAASAQPTSVGRVQLPGQGGFACRGYGGQALRVRRIVAGPHRKCRPRPVSA
jgi:hypothetical protein